MNKAIEEIKEEIKFSEEEAKAKKIIATICCLIVLIGLILIYDPVSEKNQEICKSKCKELGFSNGIALKNILGQTNCRCSLKKIKYLDLNNLGLNQHQGK